MTAARLHLESLPPRVTRSELLQFILDVGGIDHRRLGKLELRGSQAAIEVPSGWEGRLVKALSAAPFRERTLLVWAEGSSTAPAAHSEHFDRLMRLLDLESHAEAERTVERGRKLSGAAAERSGNSLVDLVIIDEDAGLGGRFLLQLAKRSRRPLPWTRLDVGSPVALSAADSADARSLVRGIICERSASAVRVATTNVPDALENHDRFRLDLSHDEVAVERQRTALRIARHAHGDRLAELRAVLLGERQPEFDAEAIQPDALPGIPGRADPLVDSAYLNHAQRAAVALALAARDVALIHGPPGTGKSTTLAEVVRRLVARGEKVLVCAPSNLGVDNLFERLLAADIRAVRLGHPARVLPQLRANTLDLLVEEHHDVRLAHKLVKDALALFRRADRYTRARPQPRQRQKLRQEAKSLLADSRRLEAQAIQHILDTADVLCATTTGLDDFLLGQRRFDSVVIDEACQSTEPGCWIPLARGDRLILAGDHRQLPPTVISGAAQSQGFAVSLFERLAESCGDRVARRLEVQYRMNTDIMGFSAAEFYGGTLVADPAVAHHRLSDLIGTATADLSVADLRPLDFIDTAGAGFDEELEPEGDSRFNPREAAEVVRQVRQLLDSGLPPAAIAVISPYAAQVRYLRDQLPLSGLEIDSVDGFQGREKEVVVISLVRSNRVGEIGFLADTRRTNVAMTRARRRLAIIGDSATLSHDPFYARLVEYCQRSSAYRSVWELSVAPN